MSHLAFASVWLVMVLPCTERFLKLTPLMFTDDDLPCMLMTCFTSEATFVKLMYWYLPVSAAVRQVGGMSSARLISMLSTASTRMFEKVMLLTVAVSSASMVMARQARMMSMSSKVMVSM